MALNLFTLIFGTHTDILDMPVEYVEVGYGVSVMRDEYGTEYEYSQRVGTIESIGLSPYYSEAQQGIERAYIVGSNFTEYVKLEDLMHHI